MNPSDPLILTARFDAVAAALFQMRRDTHFPARLNIVPAHCTLFHHLPGEDVPGVATALEKACAGVAPFGFATTGFRFLGRGVAYEIGAPPLVDLRGRLAALWADRLTPQDRQGFRPHVTIQNKAEPAEARRLLARLERDGVSVTGSVLGLDLWAYRGGPWDAVAHIPFAA